MKTVNYSRNRNVDVIKDADVVVVGGGPGGLGAAVMAARTGAKTLLIERYGHLGGMATTGEVHPFMANNHKPDERPPIRMDQPVHKEWIERMHSYLPESMNTDDVTGRGQRINIPNASLAAEDLCLEAGVELLYHHWLADCNVVDGKITELFLLSKSGIVAVKGKTFVDCTGDADLAALAGCEFEQGGPNGSCQPMTTCFKLTGVEPDRLPPRKEINELYNQAKEAGRIDNPRENVLMFNHFDDSTMHFNTTRIIHKSGTDGLELSEAEIEGRRQVRQMVVWLRETIPGFESASLLTMAQHIGVRETRRVRGLAFLTEEAFANRQKFDDAVCRCNYPIDIHSPDGSGTRLEHMSNKDFYEIPYGCIVSKDIRNLCVGGRPISVDHVIHSSMRVMAPACSLGSAAGMACAMAVAGNCSPQELDGVKVRENLRAQGAYL